MPKWSSRLTKSHLKWRQIAKDYPELKEILLDHKDANFHDICKHSPREDKRCPYAQVDDEVTTCALLVDWWDDWDVEQLKECFATYPKRKRLSWRNIKLRELGLINERRRV